MGMRWFDSDGWSKRRETAPFKVEGANEELMHRRPVARCGKQELYDTEELAMRPPHTITWD